MTSQDGNLTGVPALLLFGIVGVAVLLFTARLFMGGTSSGVSSAFVAGLASGYVAPFTVRLATMLNHPLPSLKGRAWFGMMVIFFIPLIAAGVMYGIVTYRIAQAFSVGVMSQWFMGLGLIVMGISGNSIVKNLLLKTLLMVFTILCAGPVVIDSQMSLRYSFIFGSSLGR